MVNGNSGSARSIVSNASRRIRLGSQLFVNSALTATGLRRREDVEEAIRRQYLVSEKRLPDARELNQWCDAISKEGLSLRRVLNNISKSTVGRSYRDWIELYDTIIDEDRKEIKAHIRSLALRPLISVVTPVYDTREDVLREAIESVRTQLYENWELCIADDASPSPHVSKILREYLSKDPRIKWIRCESNGHVSAASNAALALATGEFVALLDHDGILPEQSLYEVVVEVNRTPDAAIIYSDEDRIVDGVRCDPHFKTDWNPELFLGCNMISHLGVYRRSLLAKIGGFRLGFEGSQNYDLALRAIDVIPAEKIRHIPAILYHRRRDHDKGSLSIDEPGKCADATRRAKNEFFHRRNETAEAVENPLAPQYDRILRPLPHQRPLVSLIVPTRNHHEILGPCIDGLLHRTDYKEIEIIIVDHESDEPATLELLDRLRAEDRIRIIPHTGPFNYSEINNKAVRQARGGIIGLINNDIDVIDPGWLSEMVALAVIPANGVIGAKLLYPDGRIQHAGVTMGVGGVAGHAFRFFDRTSPGYFCRLLMTSNLSAVTGACQVMRKAIYEEVGGLNECDLQVSLNDIDLCLKIQAAGYRNVWTPFALLYHYESISRGPDIDPKQIARAQREGDYMQRVWGDRLNNDPFYNVNLSLNDEAFNLAFPPRRLKPWRQLGATTGRATSSARDKR